jgi:hypothetical protein
MRPESNRSCLVGLAIATLLCSSSSARAADYFFGKSIKIVVGSGAGGGFDIYGRVIARHLVRYIPGVPTVVVQNMPGAGGGKAANFIYAVAPSDGTAIGAILPGTIFNPLLAGSTQLYNPSKFRYVGTADNGIRLCVSPAGSRIKSFDDVLEREVTVGATAPGSSMFDYAQLLRNIANAKFKIIGGYQNTAQISLAMERGEVDAVCGWDWSSVKAQHPDYQQRFNIILQASMVASEELSKLGVKMVQEYVRDGDDRAVLELFLAQQIFGRPYVAPPGIAPEPLSILRRAFEETMADRLFLDDAAKLQLQIVAASGRMVEDVVSKMYRTPKHIIDRAAAVVKP